MKDPVTISTGITYDRESIEKWIFSRKNTTCPITKQLLSDADMIPNHTLRRLIQSWCSLNASNGVERFPTPKPPANKTQIVKLLNDAKSPLIQTQCLRRLRSIASASEANKRCIESASGAEFLASLINLSTTTTTTTAAADTAPASYSFVDGNDSFDQLKRSSDEALSILHHLKLSDGALRSLAGNNGQFINSLLRVMQGENNESRAYAVLLMNSILEVAQSMEITSLKAKFFTELVRILRDRISYKASKASLQLLINVCPWGRNRVKAVEAGAVPVLIDLLLDSPEKRAAEMILTVLDQLCHCAEGRSEFLKHGAGLAVVSKKLLRVSKVASERAVRVLVSISKFSATPSVVQEMLQLGVVTKLCLVIQVDSGKKTKEKAREILKMHARAWKNSSCIPITLLSSYP
ncbi:hypothetical protein U1Q18_013870 [Sarracenia purpurea var. burkii]